MRQIRQAFYRADGAYPHDGGGPTIYLGRDLKDRESPERSDGRRHRENLCRELEIGLEGRGALSRWFETLTALKLGQFHQGRRGDRGRDSTPAASFAEEAHGHDARSQDRKNTRLT